MNREYFFGRVSRDRKERGVLVYLLRTRSSPFCGGGAGSFLARPTILAQGQGTKDQ